MSHAYDGRTRPKVTPRAAAAPRRQVPVFILWTFLRYQIHVCVALARHRRRVRRTAPRAMSTARALGARQRVERASSHRGASLASRRGRASGAGRDNDRADEAMGHDRGRAFTCLGVGDRAERPGHDCGHSDARRGVERRDRHRAVEWGGCGGDCWARVRRRARRRAGERTFSLRVIARRMGWCMSAILTLVRVWAENYR